MILSYANHDCLAPRQAGPAEVPQKAFAQALMKSASEPAPLAAPCCWAQPYRLVLHLASGFPSHKNRRMSFSTAAIIAGVSRPV